MEKIILGSSGMWAVYRVGLGGKADAKLRDSPIWQGLDTPAASSILTCNDKNRCWPEVA
ncbi:MAG TPA: hypothetical protein VGB13_03905 [Candidatus Krumholzibacteria bacterium]